MDCGTRRARVWQNVGESNTKVTLLLHCPAARRRLPLVHHRRNQQAVSMENPHEERQSLLLERITKNVHRLNEALLELDKSVVEINNHNQSITIVAELSEAVSILFSCRSTWHKVALTHHPLFPSDRHCHDQYRRNAAFNLSNMEAADDDAVSKSSMDL
ncbi:hypothetical protein PHSY_003096 [Pseudozyma hubeiensis SY62]|uniref:DASH complex subunit DAD4 n=1 Tax=Pseudozyma hubeiensis (strain SY62) TaxID=1305764 RepID=R9PBQ9_PSEHS|nr:hypothetical protein PHSY_003096 [Pseudozyma hubeiensis SY62]GAC95520.1 hypothetical protein PHSY_003096 [Pseudozyma hubeiensis SY62]